MCGFKNYFLKYPMKKVIVDGPESVSILLIWKVRLKPSSLSRAQLGSDL